MSGDICSECERPADHARGLCSRCYQRARRAGALPDYERATRTWPDLAEDIEILLTRTSDVTLIAARLGTTVAAISRAGYRNGRADLARPFSAAAKRERKSA
jgi:predicted amidophosphoribosyltransferase